MVVFKHIPNFPDTVRSKFDFSLIFEHDRIIDRVHDRDFDHRVLIFRISRRIFDRKTAFFSHTVTIFCQLTFVFSSLA